MQLLITDFVTAKNPTEAVNNKRNSSNPTLKLDVINAYAWNQVTLSTYEIDLYSEFHFKF